VCVRTQFSHFGWMRSNSHTCGGIESASISRKAAQECSPRRKPWVPKSVPRAGFDSQMGMLRRLKTSFAGTALISNLLMIKSANARDPDSICSQATSTGTCAAGKGTSRRNRCANHLWKSPFVADQTRTRRKTQKANHFSRRTQKNSSRAKSTMGKGKSGQEEVIPVSRL
jgi:hypothetical protein